MKRSSSISRTFFRRPAVRELVPDLRLLLVVMTVGCESHAGVWRPAGLPEETGLEVGAVDGGLADLERRGHILRDRSTAEVFLRAWYRDNVFKGPARWGQWLEDLKQIESPRLRAAVLEAIAASPECGLNPQNVDNPKENQTNQQTAAQEKEQEQEQEQGKAAAPRASVHGGNAAAPQSDTNKNKRRRQRPSGIVTWTTDDELEAQRIECDHGADEIGDAVAALVEAGKEPVPGLVEKRLMKQARDKTALDAQRKRQAAQEQYDRSVMDSRAPRARSVGDGLLASAAVRRQAADAGPYAAGEG